MDTSHKKIYLWLWLACVFGSLSVLPYAISLKMIPETVGWIPLVIATAIQSLIINGVALGLAYYIVPKTDLNPFDRQGFLKNDLFFGAVLGCGIVFLIFLLEKLVFSASVLAGTKTSSWFGLLASLYGGITEEVLLRLFLFSVLYYFIGRIFSSSMVKRIWLLWITNILVSLVFGLGHLPAAYSLMNPSSFEIFRILLLNFLPGLVFGYLYWTRGLWSAMSAHFSADILLHGIMV